MTPAWAPLFRSAFRQSRNAMVLVDDKRFLVDVNGAFLSLSGYKRAELLGKPSHQFVAGGPAFSPQEWAERLAKAHFEGDVGIVCADGSVVLSH